MGDRLDKPGDDPADQLTILDFIRAHLDPSGCGLLPGGDDLPGAESAGELRWAPGARDGVEAHLAADGVSEADIGELMTLVGGVISSQFDPIEFDTLYERLRGQTTLDFVDEWLGVVRRSQLPRASVAELDRRLATTGRHPEPVKAGIALLGISGLSDDRDLLLTLGRHEELTLFCAAAICNSEDQPDRVLWALARSVTGWGRIHAVERLCYTQDQQIQDWVVRSGFRNTIANEYLAYIAATTGRLAERLEAGDLDDELLVAAGDIISALIAGGPAEDIDACEDAARLLEAYLREIPAQTVSLAQFVVVDDVSRFLRRDVGWPERYQRGWTSRQRASLTVACERVLSWPQWPQLAAAGLESGDDATFWAAERTAQALGLDTFGAHWRRLQANPLRGNWNAVMRLANDDRIGQIIELATAAIDPDALATGAADRLGISPEYAAHNALTFILQDLGRFPGQGWHLVRAGLRNPVVRVRNMAVKTLREWPPSAWPPPAAQALSDAARAEPADRTRQAMIEVLTQAGHRVGPA